MAAASSLTVVWVYGTLKRSFFNHAATNLASAVTLGTARTVERYPLLTLSPFRIPFLLDAPDVGQHVDGELYAVGPELLAELDALEGHPHWYVRREIAVDMVDSGERKLSQAYLLPRTLFRPELLELPEEEYQRAYTLDDHRR